MNLNGLKVLVIGSGGREHAIVKYLDMSKYHPKVFCIPGNPGISKMVSCCDLEIKPDTILNFCHENNISLVIIGPEEPLINGLSDFLRAHQILVVGPSMAAAKLEGSKAYSKIFMKNHSIPTAEFCVVDSVESCLVNAKKFSPPYVLKADGLAAGKGVFICDDFEELRQSAIKLFEQKILGQAGQTAVLEQHISGFELSYLIATNGKDYLSLPLAQDHKRLLDENHGPNTGGMGTIAPIQIESELHKKIHEQVLLPTCHGLYKDQLTYHGILFVGLMIDQNNNPYVLEYNCRFGDPETQVILPLLDQDATEFFYQLSQGQLNRSADTINKFACCVVIASQEYPEKNLLQPTILGDPFHQSKNQYFLHAGTKQKDQNLIASGGRVLCSVGLGNDMPSAIRQAYDQIPKVKWQGMQNRTDIGASQIKSSTALVDD